MTFEPTLDTQCILILGGNEATVRIMACLLARNGAIVFISSPSDIELNASLEYIRTQVPGCNVTGSTADITSADDIAQYFLNAEIALPKHDVLIYFPDKGVAGNQFMIAANRLFTLMGNHKAGQIINIGSNPTLVTELECQLLGPLGVKIVAVTIDHKGGEVDCDSVFSYQELVNTHPYGIAQTVLELLCQYNKR